MEIIPCPRCQKYIVPETSGEVLIYRCFCQKEYLGVHSYILLDRIIDHHDSPYYNEEMFFIFPHAFIKCGRYLRIVPDVQVPLNLDKIEWHEYFVSEVNKKVYGYPCEETISSYLTDDLKKFFTNIDPEYKPIATLFVDDNEQSVANYRLLKLDSYDIFDCHPLDICIDCVTRVLYRE